ncbi:hypothetical protein QUA41_30700, partial [Microcoleus sp. Pol11C1]|uniref:hypothetical protein n=1 Tax=unclassified Microcoleus TaxID=2642155 RepID=UPI002FD72593
KTAAYQRKIEALYADEAASKFKREYFPADPFDDGILVDAAWLDIADLAAIYKAAKTLENQGNEAFVKCLILSREHAHLSPLVRVNPLFVDANRQRKIEVCSLLWSFYWGDCGEFAEKRAEILEMKDPQLAEYLQQAEEALNLTAAEMEVIVNAENK